MRHRVTVVGCIRVFDSIFSYSNELDKKAYGLPQRCTRFN